MSGEEASLLARHCIPYARGAVVRSCDELTTARRECNGAHAIRVTKQQKLSARGRIPNARGLVEGARCDSMTVRRERRREHRAAMSSQHEDLSAGRSIPNTRGTVIGSRDQTLPV